MEKKLRFLAIYLPQFHPIEENDRWWGKGFTEWRNVVKGEKLNKNHYQPHIPKDLGFYDLRLAETREEQASLAKEYGIHGFVYYHYWFNGKLILEQPLQEVIRLNKPDFPFCICWANENWNRRWDGIDKEVLLEQNYSDEDNIQHIKYLCENIFNDKRYISIDGKPVFIIYKAEILPNLDKTLTIWNDIAKTYGFKGIYSIAFKKASYVQLGYDGANRLNSFAEFAPFETKPQLKRSLIDKLLIKLNMPITNRQKHRFYNYKDQVVAAHKKNYQSEKLLYPGVTPMWDNSVRRKKGNAEIFLGSTPNLYQEWLQTICEKFTPPNASENFVFINAWNEWAEGNHLEPCEKWGRAYLEATQKVARQFK